MGGYNMHGPVSLSHCNQFMSVSFQNLDYKTAVRKTMLRCIHYPQTNPCLCKGARL